MLSDIKFRKSLLYTVGLTVLVVKINLHNFSLAGCCTLTIFKFQTWFVLLSRKHENKGCQKYFAVQVTVFKGKCFTMHWSFLKTTR